MHDILILILLGQHILLNSSKKLAIENTSVSCTCATSCGLALIGAFSGDFRAIFVGRALVVGSKIMDNG